MAFVLAALTVMPAISEGCLGARRQPPSPNISRSPGCSAVMLRPTWPWPGALDVAPVFAAFLAGFGVMGGG